MMTTKHWTVSILTFTQKVLTIVQQRTISNASILMGGIGKGLIHLDIPTFECVYPGYLVVLALPCGVNKIVFSVP